MSHSGSGVAAKVENEDWDNRPKQPKKEKPQPNPQVREFIGWYKERYSALFHEAYEVSNGKDHAIVKGLLAAHDLQKLKDNTERLFAFDDPFLERTGRTIAMLKSKWNALATNGRRAIYEPKEGFGG